MIILKKFQVVDPKRSYVLMDFDRTITAHDSSTSWGLLEESEFVDPRYCEEGLALYHTYRPIELDHNMPFEVKAKHMETWHERVGALLNKYHIFEDTIDRILSNSNGLKLRKGSRNFLEQMHMLGVPVIIVSAGLGDFITKYLQSENMMFDNITIYSNFFVWGSDGKIISIKQPIIHSLNKYQLDYSEVIGDRDTGLVFGDQIEDKEMGRGLNTIDIGFCNPEIHSLEKYKSSFDIVLTDGSSYDEIGSVMIKKYQK